MSHTDPDSQVQNSTKRKEGRQLLEKTYLEKHTHTTLTVEKT